MARVPPPIDLRKWTGVANLRARLRSEGFLFPDVRAETWSAICGGAFTAEELWAEHDAVALEHFAVRYVAGPLDESMYHPQTLSKMISNARFEMPTSTAEWKQYVGPQQAQKMRELALLPADLPLVIARKSDCRTYGFELGKKYGFQRSKFEPKEQWFEKQMPKSGVIGAFNFDVGVGGMQVGPPTSFRMRFCLRLRGNDDFREGVRLDRIHGEIYGYSYVHQLSQLPFPNGYRRPSESATSDMLKLGILAYVRAFDLLLGELDEVDY